MSEKTQAPDNYVAKFAEIQAALKAPKDMDNKFGGYKYRNAESILAAVKPLLAAAGMTINLSDEIVTVGDRYYLKARASVSDGAHKWESTAWAREPVTKKGMDDSQVTGSASSYARKYALCGLLGIDDSSADPDAPENHPDNPDTQKREARIHPAAQKSAAAAMQGTATASAAKSADAIAAEIAGIDNIPALNAYYGAHKSEIGANLAPLTVRKKAIKAEIQKRVNGCSTIEQLEALQNATPGAEKADISAMFAERLGAINDAAELAAVL